MLQARKSKGRAALIAPPNHCDEQVVKLDIYIDCSNKKQEKHELVFHSHDEPNEVV
jgi:hypothetical protein